ncbi:FAD/NAD(P)-binding oxidoreductase [Zafaria cholistanensis]|uniref:FAD/NAD(P)-binding oxidoreductase n=1 Tax=Zafaria cholistanensis TaxID=1682741 RepID=A0A5A7NP71_9MICC|nr:FAD-dependent oxidoreductase [Zafaria cholistanensis]GER22704.1 FAD/NAD(P)-binding oxidoreductase [Zafaria cholistanensis]
MSAPERIVVLGFGPVAARLVEDLLPAVRAGRVLVTVVGAEVHAAYNRVLVADVGTGRTAPEAVALSDAEDLAAEGVEVRLGTAARRVDRARRTVLLSDGGVLPYDRIVFATGARAVVPVLRGLDFAPHGEPRLPEGVVALRDLDDAAALLPVVRSGGRVVVLGGGILGVEAALAIREQGARAALVHHGDIPLARALDHDGGRLLSAALAAAGVDVVPQARAVAVRLEEGRFTGLELGDGTVVPGDLLVLSVGVRARAELAEGCGLTVDRGIVVDRFLRADTEDRVFAVGDCAAVAGRPPSGLIGPGWTQAAWLAKYLVEHPAPGFLDGPGPAAPAVDPLAEERPGIILLKARGVDVAAGGDVSPGPWDSAPWGGSPQRVAVWADPQQGRYCKMVTVDGVLTGFVAVGMPRTAAELVLLYERGAELPADRSTLFRLDDAALSLPPAPAGPDDVLCRCSGATHGQVGHAVGEGCTTVEQVGASCRAGTGCGGCRDRIEALLASAASTV